VQLVKKSLRNSLPITIPRVAGIESILIVVIFIAIALVMLFHLISLTTTPVVFIDEGWLGNASWNLLRTGINFEPMHSGTLDQFGSEWIYRPLIAQLPWSLSYALFGVGFMQSRIVSWFFGGLLLLTTFEVGRRWFGRMTGAVAALILSLSLPFLDASHMSRQDVVVAFVVTGVVILLTIALKEDKWWAHFFAGLILTLSADIHLNGLMFAPGVAVVYLWVYGRSFFRRRGTWLIAAGGALGLFYYVAVHILPNPDVYFKLYAFDAAVARIQNLPIQEFNLRTVASAIRGEISRYHFYDNNLDFGLIGASIAYLISRRSWSDRFLLIFVGMAFLSFTMFVYHKDELYSILFYPFFMLAAAEAIVTLARKASATPKLNVFIVVLFIMLIANDVEHFARRYSENAGYDYNAITEQINSVVPEGARVMGMPQWWLGLTDTDYRSNLNIIFYNYHNNYTLTQALEAIRPDILIMDPWQRDWLVDDDHITVGYPGLPRQEFEDFLAQRGEKVLEFTDPWHGLFEIYAIDWDAEPATG
jgi:4-amino-4-deoxy-L-arabinose transferase-like glycosyltransferase